MRREVALRRKALMAPVPNPQEAMDAVRKALGRGRVVLADIGDNPGGGGTGGEAGLLPDLIALDRPFAFAFLVAPDIVAAAMDAGPGGIVYVAGERTEVERLQEISYTNAGPMMRGEPVLGGPGAVLRAGKGRVVVTTLRVQAYDVKAFEAHGIDLDACDVIAVKSSAHFRASFAPLATGGIFIADSGGLSSPSRAPR